ncbi:MAG: M23 family metallopeptidase, partial [Oscillospiraceae bacterium]
MSSYSDAALTLRLQFPREYVSLSRGFTSSHRGADLCWSNNYGGCYAYVTCPADGEVVACVEGKDNDTRTSNWGNYVKVKHAEGVYTLMAHLLKGTIAVKVGQKVSRGQI